MSGFVYFVRCLDRVKIGYSEDPKRRLVKIAADAPFPCELLGYVSAQTFAEVDLHNRFHQHRVHGEWFSECAEMLNFISANSVMASLPAVVSGLDPAHTVIQTLGGFPAVAQITGKHISRVYRWTYPKERGGTGGYIPQADAEKLLAHAKAKRIRLTASDFFAVAGVA